MAPVASREISPRKPHLSLLFCRKHLSLQRPRHLASQWSGAFCLLTPSCDGWVGVMPIPSSFLIQILLIVFRLLFLGWRWFCVLVLELVPFGEESAFYHPGHSVKTLIPSSITSVSRVCMSVRFSLVHSDTIFCHDNGACMSYIMHICRKIRKKRT